MPVASGILKDSARHLDAGTPLELSTPMYVWKHTAGQEKNLGMGTVEKIGQSAGQYLKTKVKSMVRLQRSQRCRDAMKGMTTRASLRYDPSPKGNFWVSRPISQWNPLSKLSQALVTGARRSPAPCHVMVI